MGNYKSNRTKKAERLERLKRKEQREQRLQAALKQKKHCKKKSMSTIIEQLFDRKLTKSDVHGNPILYTIYNCFAALSVTRNMRRRRLFKNILLHLNDKKCYKLLQDTTYIRAIAKMASYDTWVLRPIEDWQRNSHNMYKQFASLLRHCFCQYEVPLLLDKVWFQNDHVRHLWYLNVGIGKNIRKCNGLPINMTKKIAHNFMHAPEKLELDEALRYGQVLGMGGTPYTAKQIIASRLGRNNFRKEEFWEKVVLFFTNVSMLASEKMHEIIDYLDYARRQDNDYSIKGRNIDSLLRASDEWHAETQKEKANQYKIWEPCGVQEFHKKEGKKEERQTIYEIIELLTYKSLQQEGRRMRHCVGSYAYDCAKKRCSIFSLRYINHFGLEQALATIEVNLKSMTIVQTKYKCNAAINPKAKLVIQQWARKEKLKISSWVLKYDMR